MWTWYSVDQQLPATRQNIQFYIPAFETVFPGFYVERPGREIFEGNEKAYHGFFIIGYSHRHLGDITIVNDVPGTQQIFMHYVDGENKVSHWTTQAEFPTGDQVHLGENFTWGRA